MKKFSKFLNRIETQIFKANLLNYCFVISNIFDLIKQTFDENNIKSIFF